MQAMPPDYVLTWAEAVLRANEIGDFSAETLSYYETLLNNSFVMQDLNEYKGFPTLLTRREIFKDLPEMVDDIAAKLFSVDGKPNKGLIMDIVESLAQRTSARELVDLITILLEAF